MEPALSALSSLIGQVGLIGTGCLIALHLADRNVAEDELLAIVHVDSLSTLRRHLRNCEIHSFASSIKRELKGKTFWHITDLGKAIILRAISLLGLPSASTGDPAATAQPRLIAAQGDVIEEKKFFSPSSSSSSDPDQSVSESPDQNLIEEEEEREFKKFLCSKYGLIGPGAARLLADDRIWGDDIVAWMFQVGDMKREGFRFRKSPEAYALTCLFNYDRVPEKIEQEARWQLNKYWDQFCRARDAAQEAHDNDSVTTDRP